MPIATNPQTGETVYLTNDGQWSPAQVAVNPQTKERLAFDGASWQSIGKAGPTVGMGEAIGRGVKQGTTFNFGDEIEGLKAASGIPEGVRRAASMVPGTSVIAPIVGAARVGYEALTGQGDASRAYDEKVAAEREADKRAEEQRPYSYLAGNVAGAVALPVGGAANAATFSARMGAGAAIGAGTGAAYGVGEGEGFVDRATRGAMGAGIGGIGGAVGVPLVEGAIQAGRTLAAPVRRAMGGVFNPTGEAGRRVATAIERDTVADPNAASRLTPAEFQQARDAGQPVTVMDMGGDLTRRLADRAAIESPEGGTALNRTINERFGGQSGRITDWMRQTFNYPNADAQRQAIDQTARAVNRPAYQRAFQEHDGPLWDEALSGLAQDPVLQSAIRRASVAARTENTLEGYRPMNNPFSFEESTGRLTLRKDANGNTIYPDLRFWDLVKRELDKQGTRESTSFARSLREHLDEVTRGADGRSSYATARQGAAGFFGAENALEAGENFVGAGSRYGLDEARRALAGMTEPQRRLFQDGYVSRFMQSLDKVSDRRSILNQIGNSPAARAELNIALGRERALELEARLRVEGIIDLSRTAVQGNSWTARRLHDAGLAGGGVLTGYGGINQDPTQMTAGAIVAALASGGKYVDQRVARRVADLLVSNDPQLLQRGLRMVARNRRMMDALRETDRRVAAVAGEQGLSSVR